MTLPASAARAFLCTDIQESSLLWESRPQAMRLALPLHDALIDTAVAAHAGRVFKRTGDGVLAAFDSLARAVHAAADAQRAITAAQWPEHAALRVRIAVHFGEADDAGGDFLGPAINRLARLCTAAHGGQVLVSAIVARALGESPGHGLTLRPLGVFRLRGLAEPERIYQLRAPGLLDEFPDLRAAAERNTNLPAPATPFIGRDAERAEVRDLLASARVLTLVGLGGSGKTRLALRVAADLEPQFADGVWLLEAGGLSDPSVLPSAAAQALGIREASTRPPMDALIDAMRDRAALLVLDNCEHLLDACAALAETLTRRCPHVRILATSRQALRIPGEQVCRVGAMTLPDDDHDAGALQLFADRARLVRPGFTLDDRTRPDVVRICRAVGAMPLGLVLAAAQLRAMTASELADRLERSPTAAHTAVRGSIDWSIQLLSPAARLTLESLSVFAGGCTLDAAERVAEPSEGADLPEALLELVDASLATFSEHEGRGRYALPEPVRQFARDRLNAGDPARADAAARRHADHFLAHAERADPELSGPDHALWLRRLDDDAANLRAALQHFSLVGAGDRVLRMVVALQRFWYERGWLTEGRRWTQAALADPAATDAPARGRALNGLGIIARAQGDHDAALAAYEQSLAIWESLGDHKRAAALLNNIGALLTVVGRLDEASHTLERARAGRVAAGDELGVARIAMNLGILKLRQDRPHQAIDELSAALAVFRSTGDPQSAGAVLRNIAIAQHRLADHAAALDTLKESIAEHAAVTDPLASTHTLEALATVSLAAGDPPTAARAAAAAAELRNLFSLVPTDTDRAAAQSTRTAISALLDRQHLAELEAAGRLLARREGPQHVAGRIMESVRAHP